VSNFSQELFEEAMSYTRVDCIQLGGLKLSPDDFRQGRRLFKPEHLEAETPLVHCVKKIADRHGVKPAEVAIAWILHQPENTSAIVGTQNIAHLEENVRAVDFSLNEVTSANWMK